MDSLPLINEASFIIHPVKLLSFHNPLRVCIHIGRHISAFCLTGPTVPHWIHMSETNWNFTEIVIKRLELLVTGKSSILDKIMVYISLGCVRSKQNWNVGMNGMWKYGLKKTSSQATVSNPLMMVVLINHYKSCDAKMFETLV